MQWWFSLSSLFLLLGLYMWTRRNERRNGKKKNLSSHMLVHWVGQYIAEFRFAKWEVFSCEWDLFSLHGFHLLLLCSKLTWMLPFSLLNEHVVWALWEGMRWGWWLVLLLLVRQQTIKACGWTKIYMVFGRLNRRANQRLLRNAKEQ